MGGLGWTPAVVRHEATLNDLAEAIEGYRLAQRGMHFGIPGPGASFLRAMMNKFPDHKDI